jgi:hypothetical protein
MSRPHDCEYDQIESSFSEADIKHLARLAGVPLENEQYFCTTIRAWLAGIVVRMHHADDMERERKAHEDLKEMRRLSASLARLLDQDQEAFDLERLAGPSLIESARAFVSEIDACDLLKRSKPPTVFEMLAWGIFTDVQGSGGNLTLTRHLKRGTLIDFFEALRSMLPAGTIPNVLPLKQLETIKAGTALRFPRKAR